MNLIQEYFVLVKEVITFDVRVYDTATAESHNQKVNRMGEIAEEIERSHPELKHDFCQLLSDEHMQIRLWAAHHILERMNCDGVFRKKALAVIRRKARTDKTTHGFCEKVWLRDWYRRHPKDRWI